MDMEADVKMFNVNVSFLPCISPLLQCVNNTSSLDATDLGRHDPLPLCDERALGAEAVPPPAVPLVPLQRGHVPVVAAPRALRGPLVPLTGLAQQKGVGQVGHHDLLGTPCSTRACSAGNTL